MCDHSRLPYTFSNKYISISNLYIYSNIYIMFNEYASIIYLFVFSL